MKTQLQLEYSMFLILGIFAFAQTGVSWWYFLGLFFVPDISMLGYIINNKVGAASYNLFHNLGVAIAIYLVGVYFPLPYLNIIGAILFAHSSFDRILGYGLKYPDRFQNTHLGNIGKKKNN